MRTLIRGGRLIDPANGIDTVADLYLAEGRIAAIGQAPEGFAPERTIEAGEQLVCPGLVDLRARLGEPGHEHCGTIASETRAAAAGGITTVCCPPDTQPVIDSTAVVELIHHRTLEAGCSRVLPLGALTAGLASEQISEMAALKQAGCIAMSNGQRSMSDTLVMRRALEYAASIDLPVLLYAEDPWLGASGCMHEGEVNARLGLGGIPTCAEVITVQRDLTLIEQTGVRAHFCTLSSTRAVEMVAEAQARGIRVTADVSAHQLYLTEMDVDQFNSQCHLRPPLRSRRDLNGLRAGLADGTLSAVCSDHQPLDLDAKLAPFAASEPGASTLETLLPLTLRLVDEGVLSLSEAITRLTSGPAAILGLKQGNLAVGRPADICIIDPQRYWSVSPESLRSRGKNSPFLGWELKGRVTHTLLEGLPVFADAPSATD